MNDERKDPPDHLDPATVRAVAVRGAEWLQEFARAVPNAAGAATTAEDLATLARDAHELVQRQGHLGKPWPGMGSLSPQRPVPVPLWWRDEYRDDPLLAALAQYGAPAGRALVAVIDAYRSLHGIVMGVALRQPPEPMRFEVPTSKGWTDAEIVDVVRAAAQAHGAEAEGDVDFAAPLFLGLRRAPVWTPERTHALWVALGRPELSLLVKDATGIATMEREQRVREAGATPK